MLTGPRVILTLQVAVLVVTLILVAALVALAYGRFRLHGRLNLAFFVLTLAAVLGLEVLIRFVDPGVFEYIHSREELRQGLRTHLCFAVPALILMPLMLYTGLTHRRGLHLSLACLFGIAWLGTVWTGLFFLPTQ
ncbi:MAG: hypothetical protein SNJ82_06360 [Gemmataceae bacterium]